MKSKVWDQELDWQLGLGLYKTLRGLDVELCCGGHSNGIMGFGYGMLVG